MKVSVVIASRDRPQLLGRLLASLRVQIETLAGDGEIVVVDDGSSPPYDASLVHDALLVRTNGGGPARARNAGIARSRGEIVLFADDDVIVEPGWITAALSYLDRHPEYAGVTGDTSSPTFDPIYEHSVEDHVGGSFLTCNSAYRRSALVAVGGFDRLFAHAHEDRDLAFRVRDTVGPIGVEPAMRVTHPGRPFSVRAAWRRATFIYDDWLFFARYPTARASTRSARWTPVWNSLRTWRNVGRGASLWRRPRALGRYLVIASGQVAISGWLAATKWSTLVARDSAVVPGLSHPTWRIAYVGPSPDPAAGGAPGVAGLLLDQLLQRGCNIDVFVAASKEDDDPRALGSRAGLTYEIGQSSFAFGRWYSRGRITKFVSLQLFAVVARRRLARRLRALHAASPYDFIYQFSTLESFGVPRRGRAPLVIHPSVHAAGELRWLREERSQSFSDDAQWRRALIRAVMTVRARRQRRDARSADGVLALSHTFADQLVADYGLRASKVRVVPNCVNVQSIDFSDAKGQDLIVAGRVAVRKGLEDVAALSHRPIGRKILVFGSPSLWSDYSKVLRSGDPECLVLAGSRPRTEVEVAMAQSMALLQLSRYEPFALTVAESLAAGTPVIATSAVGAIEEVARDVVTVVSPCDIDALEHAVEGIAELRDDERALLAHRCRSEAERLFSPERVADQLVQAFAELLN